MLFGDLNSLSLLLVDSEVESDLQIAFPHRNQAIPLQQSLRAPQRPPVLGLSAPDTLVDDGTNLDSEFLEFQGCHFYKDNFKSFCL